MLGTFPHILRAKFGSDLSCETLGAQILSCLTLNAKRLHAGYGPLAAGHVS